MDQKYLEDLQVTTESLCSLLRDLGSITKLIQETQIQPIVLGDCTLSIVDRLRPNGELPKIVIFSLDHNMTALMKILKIIEDDTRARIDQKLDKIKEMKTNGK